MGDSLLTARGPGATVSVLRGPSVLADLGDELDDLLAATGAPIPARRPWLQAWVDAFTDHGPWAVVVRSPDRLEGVALLPIESAEDTPSTSMPMLPPTQPPFILPAGYRWDLAGPLFDIS